MEAIRQAVQDIRELTRMKEELEAEITAAQDIIKAEMSAQQVDTLTGSDFKVTWKEVISSRIDTTALKKALPELCEQYTKQTTTKRFCIA